jgi:hypothetical protein
MTREYEMTRGYVVNVTPHFEAQLENLADRRIV